MVVMVKTAHKDRPVYGERIREARSIRGFSQTVLAELVHVKRQAISAFEKDKIKPSPETLFAISSITGFPIPFFLNERPRGDSIRTAPISFRKKAATTKTTKIQAEEYEKIFADIYYYLDQYLDFHPAHIPFNENLDYRTLDKEDIERIAVKVRRAWGLGDGPIPSLTRLLENNGIIIVSITLPDTLDAFSTWRHNRPFILLSDGNKSGVRRRFNLSHELGHLILHQMVEEKAFEDPEQLDKLEGQAHRFAGAFLFPAQSVYNEYFSNSIPALKKLKGRWRLSIGAIARRLLDLGLISKHQYKYLNMQLGSDRKHEPLDDSIPCEKPELIKRAFEVLLQNRILSIQNAVDDLMISETTFSMLTGIEPERPNRGEETIIPFRMRT
jgi:Zn-dependent peptidase ImmA (M78 family)/transcriptional regulator with XRE-family HTH domain